MSPLQDLLAHFRAAFLLYQTGHWTAKGPSYYAVHLLLQRIYEETAGHIDQLGERLVGYYGEGAVESKEASQRMTALVAQYADGDPVRTALRVTQAVQDTIASAYNGLGGTGKVPMGLDDLLLTFASNTDTHLYLLKRQAGIQ